MIALAATLALAPRPRLVWNLSPSAPLGHALTPPSEAREGDTVVAWPPAPWRDFAAARRHLPRNVPLVKRVAAGPRARVCALGPALHVDARLVATLRARDGQGRAMPWWNGCTALAEGRLLLLMDAPDSITSLSDQ